MEITSTTDPELNDPRGARLERIRKYIALGGLINNDDAALLLSLLDRHKGGEIAALDRVVELERELDKWICAMGDRNFDALGEEIQKRERLADVRGLCDSLREMLDEYATEMPLAYESEVREALAKVRTWCK